MNANALMAAKNAAGEHVVAAKQAATEHALAVKHALVEHLAAGGGVTTNGLQTWLQSNIIPLLLLLVAVIVLWLGGGKGDNAGVMRRIGGVVLGLGVIGLALNGGGIHIGQWIAHLFGG